MRRLTTLAFTLVLVQLGWSAALSPFTGSSRVLAAADSPTTLEASQAAQPPPPPPPPPRFGIAIDPMTTIPKPLALFIGALETLIIVAAIVLAIVLPSRRGSQRRTDARA